MTKIFNLPAGSLYHRGMTSSFFLWQRIWEPLLTSPLTPPPLTLFPLAPAIQLVISKLMSPKRSQGSLCWLSQSWGEGAVVYVGQEFSEPVTPVFPNSTSQSKINCVPTHPHFSALPGGFNTVGLISMRISAVIYKTHSIGTGGLAPCSPSPGTSFQAWSVGKVNLIPQGRMSSLSGYVFWQYTRTFLFPNLKKYKETVSKVSKI